MPEGGPEELKKTARLPSKQTTAKYGLTVDEWVAILKNQGDVCYICKRLPDNLTLCVDHAHLPNFKKLPPNIRKLHVRGILCHYCNFRLLPKGLTVEKSRNITQYLEAFEPNVQVIAKLVSELKNKIKLEKELQRLTKKQAKKK